MYICMYVHMCCVLIRPPIPQIKSSRCKNFILKSFLLHKRTNTRVPPCNDLDNLLFVKFMKESLRIFLKKKFVIKFMMIRMYVM